jgi:hypothetical protein
LAFQLAPDVVVAVVVVEAGAVVVVVEDFVVVDLVVVDFVVVDVDEESTTFALVPGISVATAIPTDVVASAAMRTTEAVTIRMRRATYARLGLAFVSRSSRRCGYIFFSELVCHEGQLTPST